MAFKKLLKEKDIHGTQLARKIGCERSLVSCWVRGKCRPTLDMIPKIAKALDVTIEDIVKCFVEV
ncbi:MAG: helix-turn-helix transcriptional regulator [Clostridia bacterium]|nr:helix-turn-helix transcriptional regulator [Clostridia bacterium]